MNPDELRRSVVHITSSDSSINDFGTGFVINQYGITYYILTCAHVVEAVGDKDKVRVDGFDAKVVTSGKDLGLDLAILTVLGPLDKEPLKLGETGTGSSFITAGYGQYGPRHRCKTLSGTLVSQVDDLIPSEPFNPIKVWELGFDESNELKEGYSGSPVVNPENDEVLGVIIDRKGSRSGSAIAIKELERIWKVEVVDRQILYENLLELNYRKQEQLFRELVNRLNEEKKSGAAFLIQGSSEEDGQFCLGASYTS